jgi:hypothetical protein
VERVFDETPADALTKMADEMFKTRDGFISFYDHQWRNWGPPEDWDQNQIWCLLRAYVGKDFDQYAELDLMERARCNGHLDTWLYDCNPEAGRLCKIHDYLRRRAARLETA